MTSTSSLGTGKISRLLVGLAVPSIIAQLVNLMYNIVDRIYIGQIPDSTLAMAGLSTSLPIITMIMAFTQLVGVGGAPLCAIKLGEKDKDGAEKIMTNSFSTLIIVGIMITIILLTFKNPILYLFGATDTTIVPASEYISIYALGTVFVQISLGMNSYINTQGFAKTGMFTVLIGAIINIVLDPIFIFHFGMGVKGAALATIISQGISAIWVLKFLFGKKSTIKIRKEYLIPQLKVILPILSLGISPFAMTSTESLLQISFINQLSAYGGTLAVASMAIINSLAQFITMPLYGIAQGAQPILSYNYGAKQYDRVKEAFKLAFTCCLTISILFSCLIMVFSKPLAGFFSTDPQTIEFTAWALRIYICGMTVFGAQLACQQSFMALGQAKTSLMIALLRKVILLIPFIYIFPVLFGDTAFALTVSASISSFVSEGGKVFFVLFAEPVADFLAAAITITVFYRFYKKKLKNTD